VALGLIVEEIAQAVFLKLEEKQVHTQRLVDIDQAARYLGMSPYSLRHKAGVEIPVVRLDAKLRFDRRDLDKFIDAAKREGGSRSRSTHDRRAERMQCTHRREVLEQPQREDSAGRT
jgi:hypothetical protein